MNTPRIEFPASVTAVTPANGEVAAAAAAENAFATFLPVSSPSGEDGGMSLENPVEMASTDPKDDNRNLTAVSDATMAAVAMWMMTTDPVVQHPQPPVSVAPPPSTVVTTMPVSAELPTPRTTLEPVASSSPSASPPLAVDAPTIAVLEVQKPVGETASPNGTPLAVDLPKSDTAGGTAGAKEVATMKQAVPTEELATLTEQELPGRQRLPVAEAVGTSVPMAFRPADRVVPGAGVVIEPVATTTTVSVAESMRSEPVAESAAPAIRAADAQRVAATVWEQVVTFRRLGVTEAEVRVQPDRQTELTLQLKWQAGQVQLVARLERGDFETLQRHWGALQETLSAQGVRVAALQPGSGADLLSAHGDGGRSGRDGGWNGRDETMRNEPVVWDEPVGAPMRSSREERRLTGHGWERWA